MLEIFMTKFFIAAGFVGALSLLLTAIGLVPNTTPIVTIENGQLQGRTGYSYEGKEYLEFLGIPYAEPPIGELRFEPPVPLKHPWTEVKQMTQYPPRCLQFESLFLGRVRGTEDCLYLNVFTYDVNPEKLKPVLFYIHGGGFAQGVSSFYGPSLMMNEDIVLVTINYRLGPLGFMNTGDGLIRGNMGLKDQNVALKWVQRNIARFGGDASQVCIFGESAGAASVHYHMLSPLSHGLFQKAIAQSGVALSPWAFEQNPRKITMDYVKLLNCQSENMEELVECLKTMDGEELVKQQISMMDPTNDFLLFVPSIEAVVKEDTFLSEDPQDILKSGNYSKVPLMLGVNSGEGGFRTARFDAIPELISVIDKNWDNTGHAVISYDSLHGNTKILQKIRKMYFGKSSFTENTHEFKNNLTLLISDVMFFEPTHTTALLRVTHGAPTYLYFYDYESSLPDVYSVCGAVRADDWILSELKVAWSVVVDFLKKHYLGGEGPHDFGVTHANDLLQIWNLEGISAYLMGKDYQFSRSLVKTIVDYANNTQPLKFGGATWPRIELPSLGGPLKYMVLDQDPVIIDEPFADRMPFWESLRCTVRSKYK